MFLLQFDLPLFSFTFNFKNCRCLNENLLGTLFCHVFFLFCKSFRSCRLQLVVSKLQCFERNALVADWYQRSPCNLKTIVGLRFRRSGTNIMPQYAAVWEEKESKWKNKKQKTKNKCKGSLCCLVSNTTFGFENEAC